MLLFHADNLILLHENFKSLNTKTEQNHSQNQNAPLGDNIGVYTCFWTFQN